ncbi:hypothetical protein CG51_05925 [Haematobacter missouriensis]|uniref:ClpX-type ZB domain-containing protein n=1 Tax=Haematobacter missouriensis TaxID=366616 RepID=A0A212AQM0_9RHOB|nr:ClpX C4-type zinc finger protein [Haematobacter missouriensis]KFI31044.1 hypothetical protein CG51_05925 [Haematobacter missouriensis]OWJ73896.1 hypothetical protein CDV53_14295 [Haematobacter missouriensis]OWJ83807.1 hypothetical protein CDV52_09870 [Haematobacter missouriensis]
MMGTIKERDVVFCSFCGKDQHEVECIVVGPEPRGITAICNECIEIAMHTVISVRIKARGNSLPDRKEGE